MRRSLRVAASIAAALTVSTPVLVDTATASAESSVTILPFAQKLRRCDHTPFQYVGGSYYGRAQAQVRVQGGGPTEVIADLQFATGVPFASYDVRLIQLPRSSAAGCAPGAPGVASATLVTDGAGGGSVTVRGPLMSGATGAWMSVTRPSAHSAQPEEFYTSDIAAPL
jgi:hypothetical protein